jgi:GT2 family glycosyltransferase
VLKDQIIENLNIVWNKFDNKKLPNFYSLKEVMNEKETILSVAMLSLYRTNKLLEMMNHWGDSRFIKSNLSLRVQGSELLGNSDRKLIKKTAKKNFQETSIFYNEENRGSGQPRHEMVHKALEYNTPYIMTTDDDMFFPPGSIESQISILKDNSDIGAVTFWCSPNLNFWDAIGNRMIPRQPTPPFDFGDAVGSGTMVMKREIFDTCDLDPGYFVGWGDLDFCMQIRKAGWKIGMLCIPGFKALNDSRGNTPKYRENRYNKIWAEESRKRFYGKWNRMI